ncbi:MAG: sigma-54-dependent Fis family transcriptional regulator, partial [Deltaproteobacteria bacterium]|nr:sigma-54-dependent Fis family transcriptional regulator [Deltaproteobacteria bacterium]
REHRFRDDLYYRLSMMTIELPPLRSYQDDNLDTLVLVFLRQAAQRHKLNVTRIGGEAMALLRAYDFPGNVRELKNAIEHAAIMSGREEILPGDLPKSIRAGGATPTAPAQTPETHKSLKELREAWLAPFEIRYLSELLEECGGNVRQAAKRAGVNTVTMYRLLKKRGLKLDRRVRRED